MAALSARLVEDVSEPRERSATAPSPLVCALDVGVSKTVCLAARRGVALLHAEHPMQVVGVGRQTAPAIASGKPGDFDACARAIRVAIDEAAAMAGAPIQRVTASYAGPGLEARVSRGAARIKGAVVTGRDIDAALEAAAQAAPAPHLTFLHVEPLRFTIDDGEELADPVGLPGRVLAVEACVVTAPTEALNALKACIRQAGAEVEDIIAAPMAVGLAALTPEERAEGALIIDLGAGSTGLAVFAEDGLLHAESLPIGGVRLTRDLALKLQTTFAAAERIKLQFGAVGAACDPREAVQAPKLGFDGRLEAATTLRGVIADTLTPRVYELLLLARERLARAGFAGAAAPLRAVLVGGGAMMPGLRDLAVKALAMPVRIARPELSGFEHCEGDLAYAAAAGLLRHRLETPTLDDVDAQLQPSLAHAAQMLRSAASGAWSWLRDNF